MLIEPLIPELPRRDDGRGRPWRDTREVMNGVVWIQRTLKKIGRILFHRSVEWPKVGSMFIDADYAR